MKAFLHISAFWGAVLVGAWIWSSGDIQRPPGILVREAPRQVEITPLTWKRGNLRFTALAQFDVRARVLSVNNYRADAQSSFSPLDLAVGWGPMSDSDILKDLVISQSQRFYFWRPRLGQPMPISKQALNLNSANMHMIPADESVKKILEEIRVGEIADISGYLVDVNGPRGSLFRTSLSRSDTGNGACEVVWAEHVTHDD